MARPNLPHQNCPVNLKKRPFTCAERSCKVHFWLCDKKDHIKLNTEKFERPNIIGPERVKYLSILPMFIISNLKCKPKLSLSIMKLL